MVVTIRKGLVIVFNNAIDGFIGTGRSVSPVGRLWFNPPSHAPHGLAHSPVSKLTETIAEILQAHRTGAATPADTVARTYARIRAHADPALFISLRDEAAAIAEAKALMAAGADGRLLYGIPVAIKDNIDTEGMPTTAACPAFAYKPARDATVVARLRRAGCSRGCVTPSQEMTFE